MICKCCRADYHDQPNGCNTDIWYAGVSIPNSKDQHKNKG